MLRVERDLSQQRLALAADIDRAYVGRIERGSENVTVHTLELLAIALRVPYDAQRWGATVADLSRRSLLAGAPAATIAVVTPVAAVAAVAVAAGSDSILAVVEAHRAAWRAFDDAVGATEARADSEDREMTAAEIAFYTEANEAEEATYEALLEHPCTTVEDAWAKAAYLLACPSAKGCAWDDRQVELLLQSLAGSAMLDRPTKTLSPQDLENLISDVGPAGAVIEVIADMLNSCRVKTPDDPGVRDGYTVLRLTEAQDRALFAATTQAAHVASRLDDAFYAGDGT